MKAQEMKGPSVGSSFPSSRFVPWSCLGVATRAILVVFLLVYTIVLLVLCLELWAVVKGSTKSLVFKDVREFSFTRGMKRETERKDSIQILSAVPCWEHIEVCLVGNVLSWDRRQQLRCSWTTCKIVNSNSRSRRNNGYLC